MNCGYFFYDQNTVNEKAIYNRMASLAQVEMNGDSFQRALNSATRYQSNNPNASIVICEGILYVAAHRFYYDYNSFDEIYNFNRENHITIFSFDGNEYEALYSPDCVKVLTNNVNSILNSGSHNFDRVDVFQHRTDIIFVPNKKPIDNGFWQKEGF